MLRMRTFGARSGCNEIEAGRAITARTGSCVRLQPRPKDVLSPERVAFGEMFATWKMRLRFSIGDLIFPGIPLYEKELNLSLYATRVG